MLLCSSSQSLVNSETAGLRDGSAPEVCEPAMAGCAGREAEALRPSGPAACGRAGRSRGFAARRGVVLTRRDLGRR